MYLTGGRKEQMSIVAAVPSQVQAWYLVCRGAEVRPGKILSREFLGRPIILFRDSGGVVRALAAHCAHMGAHLGGGAVVGDHVQCPLHHWEYDGNGICRRIPDSAAIPCGARQFAYPVSERYGGVFLFNGPAPLFPSPSFSGFAETDLRVEHVPPILLRCPWFAIVANGYDVRHLKTVHKRELREPPSIIQLDRYRLQMRYVSRVTGDALPDRFMRWLSRDHIVATIMCWGGTVFTAEVDLGRVRSALLLSVLPTDRGTEVSLACGVRRTKVGIADTVRVLVARWLCLRFFLPDVAVLDGIRFSFRASVAEDECLQRYFEFLRDLPPVRSAQR